MSKYKIVKNKNSESYSIVEIENNLIVSRYKKYDLVKNIYENLKKGSGFNGWTPPFFCLKDNDQ